jgi:hypothetical protein
MLDGSFTGDSQTSPVWYGGRGGFQIGIAIAGGTNSLTIEKEVGGAWYTYGDAITASVARTYMPGVDYTPSQRFRIVCGTHDTLDITYAVQGDIFGPTVVEDLGLILEDTLLLENGEPLLRENGEYLALEAA